MSEQEPGRRLDQWLWFARFCRSRTLASTYCTKRRVRINSRAVKRASQLVRIGDVLTLPSKGNIAVVRVVDLGTRRGPASEAATLYEFVEDSGRPTDPPMARSTTSHSVVLAPSNRT